MGIFTPFGVSAGGLRRLRGAGCTLLSLAALSAAASGAFAQGPLPTADQLSLDERPREDFDATGTRVGSVVIEPSGSIGASYDSNVFAAPNHAKSDVATTERVEAKLESEWPQNAFAMKAQGEFRQYASHSSENVANAAVAANGRVDIAPNAYFLAGGGYQLLHEDRGALVAFQGKEPTQFSVTSGNAGFVIEPAPMGLRLDASVDSYAYDDVAPLSGTAFHETARDRIVYALTPRVSYTLAPQYNAFLRAVVNARQYNNPIGPDGVDRNSDGYQADGGIAFNFPGLTAGEFYVGYLEQDYRHAIKPVQAVDFGANFLWSPTRDTSVRLNVSRSAEESALPGASGFLQTAVKLAIEHEVMRDTLVLGSAAFIKAEFPGLSSSTDIIELSAGARYYIARGVSAGLEYVYRHRSSMAALPGYTREIVGFRLRGEM